jgi:hypothetical protein
MRMMNAASSAALLSALLNVSCGDDVATSPTDTTSPSTITWTTQLAPRGSASRTLDVDQSGTVFVTLQSAPLPVGLGIGVPQADGSGCRTTLSTTATAASSPQLTTAVEEGRYCVIVFDVVGLTDPITFTVEVVQP